MDIGAIGKAVAPPQAEQSQRLDTAPREAEPTELPAKDTVAAIETDTSRVDGANARREDEVDLRQSNRQQLTELRLSTTLVAANLDPTIIEWGTLDESTERRLAAQDAYPPINASAREVKDTNAQNSGNETETNPSAIEQPIDNTSFSRDARGASADVTA